MPIVVRDLLSLPSISRAGGHVVAGRSGLDRPVTRAHIGGIADIAAFLSGDEILLTAGQGMGADAKSQHAFVGSLAEAGVSALLLESAGRVFDIIPDGIISACDRYGIPLLSVRGEIAFEAVTQEVHERLRDTRTRTLEEAERVTSHMVRVLIEHHDLEPALAAFADLSGAHVLLEQAGEVRQWSAPAPADDLDQPDAFGAHFEGGCPACRPVEASAPLRTTVCTRADLAQWGWAQGVLHVLRSNRRRDPVAQLVVDRAAGLIALLLAAESAEVMRADRQLSRAVSSMMSDPRLDSANSRRLKVLAPTLTGARVLVLVLPYPPATSVAHLLRRSAGHAAVVIEQDTRTVVLVSESPGTEPRRHAADVVDAWRRGNLLEAAVGCAAGPMGDLPATVREAVLAGDLARVRAPDAGVLFVEDVPLERLLAPLAADGTLASYRREVLHAVVQHDHGSRAPLLPTLQALVSSGGNRTMAAAALNVERRTVQAHVAKLERLLGGPLDEPGRWLRLVLAVSAPSMTASRSSR